MSNRSAPTKRDGWYSRKRYAHFDLPLPFEAALAKVTDAEYVARKAHWPFLGFTDSKRRFRTINGQKVADKKTRKLKYCSHVDGYVHSYYARELLRRYEEYVLRNELADVVIGYRAGLGSNADLAKAAFDDIRSRERSTALAFDLKSFFDTIDHRTFKRHLCEVLGVDRLPNDWFNLYRSMTKFAWVDLEALIEGLELDAKKLPRPLCSDQAFKESVRGAGLVNTNPHSFGIPQGSPLSAVMSNVSMLSFDRGVSKYCRSIGASYRRYSDDILIICDTELETDVTVFLMNAVSSAGPALQLSEEKTEVSRFWMDDERLICDKPCTYLGFTFDGEKARLRSRTLSRYFRRMTYAARHAATAAKKAGKSNIFMRKLYRELSHLGRNNFYSYVRRSAEVLGDTAPRKQLRRHMRILKRKARRGGK